MHNALPVGHTLRVLDIVDGTSVDGPGLRTSVYLSGCSHHCDGCHNPQSWDPENGDIISASELIATIVDSGMNVTFTGGDPMMQADALSEVMQQLHEKHNINIWCYTGFLFENILDDPSMSKLLEWIDVLVDGPFIISQRDISLLFRGSSNQRLINVAKWRETGHLELWESSF